MNRYRTERQKMAFMLRSQGKTLKRVGLEMGITGARVRQLVVQHNKGIDAPHKTATPLGKLRNPPRIKHYLKIAK